MHSTIIPFIFLWVVSYGQQIEFSQLNSQLQGQSEIESPQLNLPFNSGIFVITPLPSLSALPEVTNRISALFPSLSTSSVRKNFQLPGSQVSTDREISNLEISSPSVIGQISHVPISNDGKISRGQYSVMPTPPTLTDRVSTIFPTLSLAGRRKFQLSASPILGDKRGISNLPVPQISYDSPISSNGNSLPKSPILTDRKMPPVSYSPFSSNEERPNLPSLPISTNRYHISESPNSINREVSRQSDFQFSAKGEKSQSPSSLIQNGIDTRTSFDNLSTGEKSDLQSLPIQNSVDTSRNSISTSNTSAIDIPTLSKIISGVKPDPNKPTHLKVSGPAKVPLSVKITRTDKLMEDEWNAFKRKYNKVYSSDQEDRFRKDIFMDNTVKISKYNDMYSRGLSGYSHRMNNYGDMLHQEFSNSLNGFDPTDLFDPTINPIGSSYIESLHVVLPDNVDWRLRGAVTPPKQQGLCKSCYAFAAVGALEGQYYRKFGSLRNLSAQEIVDCSTTHKNKGCNTGRMSQSYKYMKEKGGVTSEKSYSYQGKDSECRHKEGDEDSGSICTGYVTLTRNDEREMAVALATIGPIAAAIDANRPTMQFYSEGIYDDPECLSNPASLNHAVLIVGYGREPNGKQYWLVKNSYGSSWGGDGYFKIARGVNQCGISTESSFPLV